MVFIGLGISCIAMGLAAIGEGWGVSKAMDAIGRNPSAAKDIRTNMIVGLALIETIAIYILVVAILMAFVVKA